MSFPFYKGFSGGPREPRGPIEIPGSRALERNDPAGYIPDPGLIDAVNIALLLNQPLLLTGEPGTGKTQLAYNVSWELGFGPPLKFETKSTSTARELFYTYDTLGRFHAAQTGEGSQANLDYITYNALGVAILRANEEAAVAKWLPRGKGFVHDGRQRSVVLIDEIDKAPRDFPNDILNEVEGMYFRVPELGDARISAEEAMCPVLILTSNSEKNLPDAFLRRCIYYHLPFPDRERLAQIINARVGRFRDDKSPLLTEALDLFFLLREPNVGLAKKPSTAELLGWLTFLAETIDAEPRSLRAHQKLVSSSLSVLVKNAEDRKLALTTFDEWIKKNPA
jgi:MoxR-like ATPase